MGGSRRHTMFGAASGLALAAALCGCNSRNTASPPTTPCRDAWEQVGAAGLYDCTGVCRSSIPCDARELPFGCPGLPAGCGGHVLECTAGHIVVIASSTLPPCDAGPRDTGAPDAPRPFDAGGVHSCGEATAMVGTDPCDGGFRCGGGACDGFDSCWQCPLLLACEPLGQLTVTMTVPADACDAGVAPIDAGPDAP